MSPGWSTANSGPHGWADGLAEAAELGLGVGAEVEGPGVGPKGLQAATIQARSAAAANRFTKLGLRIQAPLGGATGRVSWTAAKPSAVNAIAPITTA